MDVQPMLLAGNQLLGSFPEEEAREFAPEAERVTLRRGDALIRSNEPIRDVLFPITSLGSLVAVLADGSTVEAGTVGREGMVGIPVVLGAMTTPMETVTQVGGDAIRVPAATFKRVFDRSSRVHDLLHRYVHALFVIASQSAACNRRHQLNERLARWLLMSSDGVGSLTVAITHDFLAVMLGVRRPGVTDAALALQDQGLIRYRRAEVEILDRERLEAVACECYRVTRDAFERVIA